VINQQRYGISPISLNFGTELGIINAFTHDNGISNMQRYAPEIFHSNDCH